MLIQDLSTQKRKFFLSLVKKRVQPGTGSSSAFLHQRTWSYAVNNLNLIIKQAPFVVVGGVTTRLYMPERMTLDLGILIKIYLPTANEDLESLIWLGKMEVGN